MAADKGKSSNDAEYGCNNIFFVGFDHGYTHIITKGDESNNILGEPKTPTDADGGNERMYDNFQISYIESVKQMFFISVFNDIDTV